jgi:hypothetical protein
LIVRKYESLILNLIKVSRNNWHIDFKMRLGNVALLTTACREYLNRPILEYYRNIVAIAHLFHLYTGASFP